MIGDKLIITKKDIKRAKDLLPRILKLKDKSIITIGGGKGYRADNRILGYLAWEF